MKRRSRDRKKEIQTGEIEKKAVGKGVFDFGRRVVFSLRSGTAAVALSWGVVGAVIVFTFWTSYLSPRLVWSYQNVEGESEFPPLQNVLVNNPQEYEFTGESTQYKNDRPFLSIDANTEYQGIAIPLKEILSSNVISFSYVVQFYSLAKSDVVVGLVRLNGKGSVDFSNRNYGIRIYPETVNKNHTSINPFYNWRESKCDYLYIGSAGAPCRVIWKNVLLYDTTAIGRYARSDSVYERMDM